MLSYPWPEGQNPFSPGGSPSIGRRMKTMLADTYAYQRLPRDKLIDESLRQIKENNQDHVFPWEVPPMINVAYNMAYGDQRCKIVEGFPNLRHDGGSCPVPGSGGADGELTGSIFFTDRPTYMPSDWSGFSTATGSIYTPSDNGTEPTVTLSTFGPNMTTSWFFGTNSSTFVTTTRSGTVTVVGPSITGTAGPSLSSQILSSSLPPSTAQQNTSSTSTSSSSTSKSMTTVSWTLTVNPPPSTTASSQSTSSSSQSTSSSSLTSPSSTPTPTPPEMSATCRQ